jgi:hypothetical protein
MLLVSQNTLGGLMSNELERMWKKAVVAQTRYYSGQMITVSMQNCTIAEEIKGVYPKQSYILSNFPTSLKLILSLKQCRYSMSMHCTNTYYHFV